MLGRENVRKLKKNQASCIDIHFLCQNKGGNGPFFGRRAELLRALVEWGACMT